MLFEGAKAERVLEEFGLKEVVMRFEQISNQTMSLLHRQIMDAEQLLMARLAAELRTTISARSLKECRVDSIVMSAGRKATEVLKKGATDYLQLRTAMFPRSLYKERRPCNFKGLL